MVNSLWRGFKTAITEITKIGKAKNCLIIPATTHRKLGWEEKQEVTISGNEENKTVEIEKVN